MLGSRFDDGLLGNSRANALSGGRGGDALQGRAGDDLLSGGGGADRMWGGDGSDVFLFGTADVGEDVERDAVRDFERGVDLIDLGAIDADGLRAGNQAFTFIGRSGFSGEAGQLQFRAGLLSGDLDGDRVAEFEVSFKDVSTLGANDIFL